ncbi:uncharacterized protein LOC142341360 [Convolutriloba macropyga]|uniref:uncharacterized protein LOC142341360 n=1 Tax=Convolutriloba macropyga TaxID=536237 RepID=UPI003F528D27
MRIKMSAYSAQIHHFAVWVMILGIMAVRTNAQVDATKQINATGCEVGRASVFKIENMLNASFYQNLYFQFKDANFLLQRIAYLSDFGITNFKSGGIGMWQMTVSEMVVAQSKIDTNTDVNLIEEYLGFRFQAATGNDIFRPIYNTLTAVILMQDYNTRTSSTIPPRRNIQDQWAYWKQVMGIQDLSGLLESHFINKSDILDDNKGEYGTGCFKCVDPPTDVVFVLDDSGSIDNGEWVQQLDFVKAVLSRLSQSMSVDATQVAFSIFGSYLYDSRDFSSDVNASISYLDSHSRRSGGTDLDAGLDEAIRIMEDSTRSRLNVTSVRKFIFFLTDGNGALSTSTVNKLRELPSVVYSIGLADGADESALEDVASDPEFVRIYQNFDDFEADIAGILYDACEISTFTVPQDEDQYHVSALLPEERRYVTLSITLGTALRLDLRALQVNNVFVIYFSCSTQLASEANYDYFVIIDSSQSVSIAIYLICPYDPDAALLNQQQDGINRIGGARRQKRQNDVVIDVSVTFIWTNTTNNCGDSCSADLEFNQTTQEVSVVRDLANEVRSNLATTQKPVEGSNNDVHTGNDGNTAWGGILENMDEHESLLLYTSGVVAAFLVLAMLIIIVATPVSLVKKPPSVGVDHRHLVIIMSTFLRDYKIPHKSERVAYHQSESIELFDHPVVEKLVIIMSTFLRDYKIPHKSERVAYHQSESIELFDHPVVEKFNDISKEVENNQTDNCELRMLNPVQLDVQSVFRQTRRRSIVQRRQTEVGEARLYQSSTSEDSSTSFNEENECSSGSSQTVPLEAKRTTN